MQPENTNTPFEHKSDDGDTTLPSVPEEPRGADGEAVVPRPREKGIVGWSAQEYIEHNHGGGWYFVLTLVTAALAASAFFISGRDYFTAVIIVVLGIIVGVAAGRKPRIIDYEITASGIRAGEKHYNYKLFKSFALIRDEDLSSINLLPTKRLMPPLSIYLPPPDEQQIVEALSRHLPYEERQMDPVERLSRRLRF